jgi:hypothetical protein
MTSFFSNSGLQEVGGETWWRARTARDKPDTRPTFLPQLRSDLVRLYEAGRRSYQNPVVCALPWAHQGAGPVVKLVGLRSSFQLSPGIAHEPAAQVFCVVKTAGAPHKQVPHLVPPPLCQLFTFPTVTSITVNTMGQIVLHSSLNSSFPHWSRYKSHHVSCD